MAGVSCDTSSVTSDCIFSDVGRLELAADGCMQGARLRARGARWLERGKSAGWWGLKDGTMAPAMAGRRRYGHHPCFLTPKNGDARRGWPETSMSSTAMQGEAGLKLFPLTWKRACNPNPNPPFRAVIFLSCAAAPLAANTFIRSARAKRRAVPCRAVLSTVLAYYSWLVTYDVRLLYVSAESATLSVHQPTHASLSRPSR